MVTVTINFQSKILWKTLKHMGPHLLSLISTKRFIFRCLLMLWEKILLERFSGWESKFRHRQSTKLWLKKEFPSNFEEKGGKQNILWKDKMGHICKFVEYCCFNKGKKYDLDFNSCLWCRTHLFVVCSGSIS